MGSEIDAKIVGLVVISEYIHFRRGLIRMLGGPLADNRYGKWKGSEQSSIILPQKYPFMVIYFLLQLVQNSTELRYGKVGLRFPGIER
jgi:hypothetical protein